jgi:DHA1 family bicyclomycin/chloramphenicol resistance-like MFS transporter
MLVPFGWHKIFLVKAAYAAALLCAYAAMVPETRLGSWRSLSVRSIFVQCFDVVTRRVDGRRIPIRYACAMGFASSCLMMFVTNASFIYQQYFGVSRFHFPMVFAASVLGFMSMNLFSMKRLGPHNAASLFRRGLAIQLFAVITLVAVVATGHVSLWTFVPFIVLMMSALGLVGPAARRATWGSFTSSRAALASVYTTLMFGLGGILGALTGFFYDGTLLPIVGAMLGASLLANAIALSLPKGAAAAS